MSQVMAGYGAVETREAIGDLSKQRGDEISWPGGYFGFPGKWSERSKLQSAELRAGWRKEYLPDATNVACSAICSAIAALIKSQFGKLDFRVTFHRSLLLYEEPLLQQCCEYFSNGVASVGTAGRTFLASSATIGLAYRVREVIRTHRDVSKDEIYRAMDVLALGEAARAMRADVRNIVCVPLLQNSDEFEGDSPVAGVLYLDSSDGEAYFDDDLVGQIVGILKEFGQMLSKSSDSWSEIRNVPLTRKKGTNFKAEKIPENIAGVFCICSNICAPVMSGALQINLDETSFAQI